MAQSLQTFHTTGTREIASLSGRVLSNLVIGLVWLLSIAAFVPFVAG